MNSLSLRVSSIKNSENLKKNSEMRVALLRLPPKYVDQVPDSDGSISEIAKFKDEFLSATSIDQQLVTVRRCLTTIGPDISTDELTQILQLLTDLFFYAPLKHPVRNAISKLLQKSQLLHGLVVKCLAETIAEQTTPSRSTALHVCDDLQLQNINSIIVSLTGCFDNFPVALTSMKMCIAPILKCIADSIRVYLDELRKLDQSPARRSEIFIFVHSAIRLCLSLLQQCFEQTFVETLDAELTQICDNCYALIDDPDVPMDTKVNSGQFLLLRAKLCDQTDEIFEDILGGKLDANAVRKLVICVGVVNTINEMHLAECNGYQVLQQIGHNFTDIAAHNAIDQNVLVATARGFVQLSKIVLQIRIAFPLPANDEQSLNDTVRLCLAFVWTFADHHMDYIRHLSRDLLKNVLKLSLKHSHAFQFVTEATLDVARTTRPTSSETIQCMALDFLCQVFGAKIIIDAVPNLNGMIMRHIGESNWAACYEKIMVSDSKNIELDSWYRRWVQPTLQHLRRRNAGSELSLMVFENLISAAIKERPEVVDLIIGEKSALPVEAYLFVMWTVRKNGLQLATQWTPALDPILRRAKTHGSDEIRIMPLRILVEVDKSTEAFSEADFQEILAFLHYNCNSQSQWMRMMISTYMKKTFERVENSHAVALRTAEESGTRIAKANVAFLVHLRDLCISNLFDGANFSRRSISLSLVQQTMPLLVKIRSAEMADDRTVWTRGLYDVLYSTIERDTYESNKVLAIAIFKCFPLTTLQTYHQDHSLVRGFQTLEAIREEMRRMLTSVRPADSLSAAYFIEYLLVCAHFADTLDAIEWCEQHLLDGLSMAETSLLKAARMNPLYGLVFCVKHLLASVDFKHVALDQWRPFIERFLGTCKTLLRVVAPIVNSASPEGHLPADDCSAFESSYSDEGSAASTSTGSTPTESTAADEATPTPQMVLLCAWRTVKEVSLLLGELTLQVPITYSRNPQLGLLSIEEILDIGHTFQNMLAEIKHRGAFEQAYVGFSKLCVRLWRSSASELHSRPMDWLIGLITLISDKQRHELSATKPSPPDGVSLRFDQICATRRSAGVPYMIQALITSELQVCSSKGLHYCMRQLLDLSRDATAQEESRTHALNILRALFRCTELGTVVAEYVSDGLEVSITGYSATTWPERNSSTLLFAALITRIFGVQRTRHADNFHIRNKLTGRIFFLRYPRLYDFIAAQLGIATAAISKNERPMNLHPLLLLLSRLYASSLEGSESTLKLSAFLPHIMQCSVCPEMETRKLAVKSMVALIAPTQIFDHVRMVLQLIAESGCDSNALHGYLLQIHYIIKSLRRAKQAPETRRDLKSLFTDMLTLNMLNTQTRTNYILRRVYADILVEILLLIHGPEDSLTYPRELDAQLDAVLCDRSSVPIHFIGRPEATKSCVLLKLLLDIYFKPTDLFNAYLSDYILAGALARQSYEHIDTILNMFLLMLDDPLTAVEEELTDEYEFTNNELAVANLVSVEEKLRLKQRLSSDVDFQAELLRMVTDPLFYQLHSVKLLTVLSRLEPCQTSAVDLNLLLDMTTGAQPDDYCNGVFRLIAAHLHVATSGGGAMIEDEQLVGKLLAAFRNSADPNSLDKLRITIALCVCGLPESCWNRSTTTTDGDRLLDYVDIILTLLRDDHYLVREYIIRHICALCEPGVAPGEQLEQLPISIRAEELFVDWLDNTNHLSALAWQKLLQRQLAVRHNCDSLSALEVFNKNEANLFGEQLQTGRLLYETMKRHLAAGAEDVIMREYGADHPIVHSNRFWAESMQ